MDEARLLNPHATAPRRLSLATLDLARAYLVGGDIRATMRRAELNLPPRGGLSLHAHYAANVGLIAEQAPLRLRPDEHLVGRPPFWKPPNMPVPAARTAAPATRRSTSARP